MRGEKQRSDVQERSYISYVRWSCSRVSGVSRAQERREKN
jgi:hypothetical protein